MIVDQVQYLARYRFFHPKIIQIEQFLQTSPWQSLDPGKYPIDDDNLYAIIEDVQGKHKTGAILEAHRRYIDLQMCVHGHDWIGWKALDNCEQLHTPYQENRDIIFYHDFPEIWTCVNNQQFAIFSPQDAHAPLGGEGSIRKLIFKIAVENH